MHDRPSECLADKAGNRNRSGSQEDGFALGDGSHNAALYEQVNPICHLELPERERLVFRYRMRIFALAILSLSLSSCAYKWGYRSRSLPGGYKQVAIPIFKNLTPQVGLETDYTNSMVRQFERSQVARVADRAFAPVRIDGVIEKLDVIQGAEINGPALNETATNPLPANAVLATSYSMHVRVRLRVRRQSDEKILWEGVFDDQTNYEAPRIGETVVNSANATYNDSAMKHALSLLADQMMTDAHDRITENF